MTKDELIREVSKLIAGLSVPRSLPGSERFLGAAKEPWDALHRGLVGFGWCNAEDYEAEIRKVLGE